MRDLFPQYYRHDDEKLKDLFKTSIFVLDANVLTALYRLPPQSREALFNALEQVGDRLWMPYHAALEYQRNRLTVINDQKGAARALEGELDRFVGEVRKLTNQHPIPKEEILDPLLKIINECKTKLQKMESEQADVNEADALRDRIDTLLKGRVGTKPSQAEVDDIDKEGAKRYADRTPPGFMDSKKEGAFLVGGVRYQLRYGDLYHWKQTLAYVAAQAPVAVILLTREQKEDWWLEVSGKKIGPQPGLADECLTAGATAFQMYNITQFLEHAGIQSKVPVSQETIEQVAELDRPVSFFDLHQPILDVYLDGSRSVDDVAFELSLLFEKYTDDYSIGTNEPLVLVMMSSDRLLPHQLVAFSKEASKVEGVDRVRSSLRQYDQPAGSRKRQLSLLFDPSDTGLRRTIRDAIEAYLPGALVTWNTGRVNVEIPNHVDNIEVEAFLNIVTGFGAEQLISPRQNTRF